MIIIEDKETLLRFLRWRKKQIKMVEKLTGWDKWTAAVNMETGPRHNSLSR